MANAQTALAIETLDRMAVQFQGIREAADLLRKIGATEGVLEDLTKRRDMLAGDIEKAERKLDETNAAHEDAQVDAKNILQSARDQAKAIVEKAKADADQITKDATASAQKTLSDEQAQREANLSTINSKVVAAQKKLKDLEAQIAVSTEKAQAAEKRVSDAQDSLDQVRAAAAKLAG